MSRRSQSGLTLVELVVAMAMTAVLALAVAVAFGAEVTMQRLHEARRTSTDQTENMELQITRLLQGARLTTATDTASYFQAVDDGSSGMTGPGRITFTTTAPGVPLASQDSTDDFATQQQNIGPVGGLAEVSLGTVAVGNAADKSGLFERIQRPSDGDPTQGGTEFVLDDQVTSIGFEFWDGLEWVTSWDTTAGGTQYHLPEAVQVSYTLKGEQGSTPHLFVVAIPASDVSATSPVTVGGTT